ncbi:unnamed protein product [Prorocentrum cordatum]|uniref:Uncharacterized protein n=1 Tax=Prorocentrum cordatum TaxID=2364126 RepID=A0ABN9YAA4_9DINO|nr:unnamed protein product [Polarella glacialis]
MSDRRRGGGKSPAPRVSFSSDYVGCKKCGYRWTYKTKQSCYSCGQALRPSYSPAPKPRGVWASGSGGWWQDNHKGADWYQEAEETTQRTEPLAIGEVVQTLGGQALSEAQRQALQQLESAFAPPAPAERPALLEEGIQRAAAAERAARRELEKRAKQLADAKLWLDECQARSDAAADALVGAEVKLAQEKKALASPGKDPQPEGTNKGGGVINLSALLGEGEASFVIEDGPLFDLEGLDITSEQRQQFNKLKQTFEASAQQAVRTHFGPGADVLKSQREQLEEIRMLRETFKKRRREHPPATAAATETSSPQTPEGSPPQAPAQAKREDPPAEAAAAEAPAAQSPERGPPQAPAQASQEAQQAAQPAAEPQGAQGASPGAASSDAGPDAGREAAGKELAEALQRARARRAEAAAKPVPL